MDELLPWLKWFVIAGCCICGAVWTLHRAFNGKADKDAVGKLSDKIDGNTKATGDLAVKVGKLETLVEGFDKKLDRALEE